MTSPNPVETTRRMLDVRVRSDGRCAQPYGGPARFYVQGDDRRHVRLERAVVDHPDGHLLLQRAGIGLEQVDLGEVVLGRLDRPDIALEALEVDLDRVGIRLARVD